MADMTNRAATIATSDFWNDNLVTERLRNVTIDATTVRQIDDLLQQDGLDSRSVYQFGKAIRDEGFRDLENAVKEDVARNFVDGNRLTPYAHMGMAAATSFRMGMTALMEMIAIDYDGTADGTHGNAEAVRELADEMYGMAVKGYANIPSLYYPRETDGECWVIRNLVAHSTIQGKLRIPLEAIGLTAEEIVENSTSRSSLVADAWWAQMLHDRASIVRSGQIFPLQTEFSHKLIERYSESVPAGTSLEQCDSGGETYFGSDEGIILCCANAITYFNEVKEALDDMVTQQDIPSLCAVVDGIVGRATDTQNSLRGLGKTL